MKQWQSLLFIAASQAVHKWADAFVNGFIDALRPNLAVPVISLFIGAITCLAVESKKKAAVRAEDNQSSLH